MFGLWLLALACKGDDEGTPTPLDTAHTGFDCATSPADWETFTEPLLRTWCTPCHSASVPEAERSGAPVGLDFDTYDDVVALGSAIASSVEAERMPPVGGLSDAERATLVGWVACGMPGAPDTTPAERCADPTPVADLASCDQGDVTLTGDLVVTQPATLDCLCAVDGSLTVEAPLDAPWLQRVGGGLTASADVLVPRLTEVGGALVVAGAGVAAVDLGAVEAAAGFRIANTSLVRLRASRLADVDGDLVLEANGQLADLVALNSVAVVHGDIRFEGNPAVPLFTLFGHLEQVDGDLILRDNDGAEAMVGLYGTEQLGGGLIIEGNDALQRLNLGIHLATVGGDLRVADNPQLGLIETFPALATVDGSLVLQGLGATEIASFPVLVDVGGLEVRDNVRLAGLAPFGFTRLGGSAVFEGNSELLDMGGFPVLTAITGDLVVQDHVRLDALDRMPQLVEVGGDLRLVDNRDLASVSTLSALTTIGGDLVVTGNPSLPTDQVDLLAGVDVGGTVTRD